MEEYQSKLGRILPACVAFKVGEGNQKRFWHDLWAGNLPLKLLYPDLFECSVDKEDIYSSTVNMHIVYGHLCFV